eukprot:2818348-Rhodomonas_salina.1
MAEMAVIANQDAIAQDAFEQGNQSVTRVYSDLTLISSQDIVPLPRTQSPPLFDHSTAEWLGTPMNVDASQPAGFEGDDYISCEEDCADTLGNPSNSQQTDTEPMSQIDGQDTISLVLQDPVQLKRVVMAKRMREGWSYCAVSPARDRGFGYGCAMNELTRRRSEHARARTAEQTGEDSVPPTPHSVTRSKAVTVASIARTQCNLAPVVAPKPS